MLTRCISVLLLGLLVPQLAWSKVKVEKDGDCKFKITFNLQFYGPGADAAFAKKVKDEVQKCWNNGYKVGCCPVMVVVDTKVGGARAACFDSIYVHDDSAGGIDDHVSVCQIGGVNGADHHGTWDNKEPAETYAHEVGHLCGLKDTYKTEGRIKMVGGKEVDCRKTKPCKGHEDDKMATLKAGAKPLQSAVEALIKAAGLDCPKECWPNTVPGTKTEGQGTVNPPGSQRRPNLGPAFMRFDLFPSGSQFTFQRSQLTGGAQVVAPIVFGTLVIETDTLVAPHLNPTHDPLEAAFVFRDFFLQIPSFDWEPGVPSGPNQVQLANLHPLAPSLGAIDDVTGQFTGVLQTLLFNAITTRAQVAASSPFASICFVQGSVDWPSGAITLQTDLCPLTAPYSPTDVTGFGLQLGLRVGYAANGSVEVRFTAGAHVSQPLELVIFDVRGRQVQVLQRGLSTNGEQLAVWERHDTSGARVAKGVYFVRLAIGERKVAQKIVLSQ